MEHSTGIATVQKLLPAGSKVLLLEDFVKEYAPACVVSSSFPEAAPARTRAETIPNRTEEMTTSPVPVPRIPSIPEQLRRMIIAPLPTCKVLRTNGPRSSKAEKISLCRESVRTLVYDVVYSLVHRRERLQRRRKYQRKRMHSRRNKPPPPPSVGAAEMQVVNGNCTRSETNGKNENTSCRVSSSTASKVQSDISNGSDRFESDDGRNVLARGFVVSREGDGPPPTGMKAGISYLHPNENVTFCRSSPVIRRLHELVGDEVLRTILLHTRCFLPIVGDCHADGMAKSAVARKGKRNRKRRREGRDVQDRDNGDSRNYILLCGPPLPSVTNHPLCKTSRDNSRCLQNDLPKRKRKRRRCFPSNALSLRNGTPGLHLHANDIISRYSLMYCDAYTPHVALPKSHPFSQRIENQPSHPHPNGDTDYRFVLNVVFDLHLENNNKQRRIRKRLEGNGRAVCEKLWKNYTRCRNYGRLLERYCGLPNDYLEETTASRTSSSSPPSSRGSDNERLARLARAFTPKDGVVSFLGSVLRRVFPAGFWGSERNFQSVMASVRCFVRLRCNERLANKNILHGISITELEWLYPTTKHQEPRAAGENPLGGANESNDRQTHSRCRGKNKSGRKQRTNHEAATELALKALRWLFRGFIIPLLRSSFYVTETEFSAKEVQYYRKPVWSLFRALSVRKLTTAPGTSGHSRHFSILPKGQAHLNLRGQTLGLSRLRFLPKPTGMRPIAQLSRNVPIRLSLPTTAEATAVVTEGRFYRKRSLASDSQGNDSRPGKRANTRSSTITATGNNVMGPDPVHPSTEPKPSESSPSELSHVFSRLPTNVILERVLHVLTLECGRRKRPYGNGMDNLQEFYTRYRNYVSHIKQQFLQEGSGSNKMQLFFAKVDIEKCYDNINQHYLLNLVQDLILNNTYVIQRVKLDSANFGGAENATRFQTLVDSVDDYQSFHSNKHALARRSRSTVFDLTKCTLTERKKILDLLREHLLQHTVVTSGRYGRKLLLQRSGISQGSTLSMLLCNLYYGQVEKLMFSEDGGHLPWSNSTANAKSTPTEPAMHLISRFVDDFLFISPDRAAFQGFLDRTHEGITELGARVNSKKTLVNVRSFVRRNADDGRTQSISLSVSSKLNRSGSVLFPWCGFLFDTETGEVFCDYERFQGGKLRDGITIDYDGNEGRKMEFRIRTFVYPRCLPILYDSSINTFETSVGNFYQMMLFAACKTAEYLRGHITHNVDHVVRCIRGLPQYAVWSIRCRFEKSPGTTQDFGAVFAVNGHLASVLSWKAFCDVFSFLQGFAVITRQLREEASSSSRTMTVRKRQQVQRIVSRAFEDFQIRHMIEK